jgi:hypothetical protein
MRSSGKLDVVAQPPAAPSHLVPQAPLQQLQMALQVDTLLVMMVRLKGQQSGWWGWRE